MKRIALTFAIALGVAAAIQACGGSSTVETHGTGGGSSGSTGTGTGTGTGGTSSTTTGTSGSGGCMPDGTLVGAANAATCCSSYADNTGKCAQPPASNSTTGTGSTTGTATSTTTATGSSTGGTCPSNMPNIQDGTVSVVDGGACSEFGCPNGFSCVNNQCILHGANGGLQVTLSWDTNNFEDLDLHVIEPNGAAVWYGDPNRPAGTSNSGAVGSLDRDSNAGCPSSGDDNVNIENVIYPATGYPTGTYKVYMDYWANCDGKSSTNYAIQVRANGQLWVYCGTANASDADQCQTQVCGTLVTTFTVN